MFQIVRLMNGLQTKTPQAYTEHKRLVLTRHYVSVLRNDCADNKRKPTAQERELLNK